MNQVLGKRTAPYRYLAPTLILMIVFLVIPIFNVVRYSFVDKAIVREDPNFVGLDNYRTLVADDSFWNATGRDTSMRLENNHYRKTSLERRDGVIF